MTQYEITKTGVKHTQLFNLKENPHEFMKEHHDPKVAAMTGVKPTKNQVNLAKDPLLKSSCRFKRTKAEK